MKDVTTVCSPHTLKCAILGVFFSIVFPTILLANDPTSSQLSYFNAYKSVYGDSWNMVWNKDNSIPLAVYGGHFTPQTSSSPLSVSNFKSFQTYNPLSSLTSLASSVCTPLPQPQLATLPVVERDSKLLISLFSPSSSYISPNSPSAINTIDFMINAYVRPDEDFESYQNEFSHDDKKDFYQHKQKGFYVYWRIRIMNQNDFAQLSTQGFLHRDECFYRTKDDDGYEHGWRRHEESRHCPWAAIMDGVTPIIPPDNVRRGEHISVPVTADIIWDGKDLNGNVLTDGQYVYQLDAKFTSTADSWDRHTKTILKDRAVTGIGSLIIDTTPPVISISAPADGTIFNTASINFAVNYTDCTSGIDISSFNTLLNQDDQTSQFTVNTDTASWSATLDNNVYSFVANIKDKAGNPAAATAHFTVLAGSAIDQYTNTMAFLESLQPLYGFKNNLSDLMPVSYFTSATQAMYVTVPDEGTQQYVAATQPKYIRFQQMYDGTIRVYDATLNVALDSNNNPTDVFGNYYNDIPAELVITPSVDFTTIMNAVLNDLGATGLSVSPTSGEHIIYKDGSGIYHVAIVLSLVTMDNTPWMYILDLHDASILNKFKTQSADYVSGWGLVYVDGATWSGNFLECSGGDCVAPLDWLISGGVKDCCTGSSNCMFGAQKALIGRFTNVLDENIPDTCTTTGVPTEGVPWNSANNYVYSPNEQSQFDEVNAYYNVTKAAEYYLNNYGFSKVPQLTIAINDPSSCGCGCTGVYTDTFGMNPYLYMNFPPFDSSLCGDTMIDFATAFHEYNHAVVYSVNGLATDINAPYKEGMAQFYGCFFPADLGYSYPHNQCISYSDANYLYPYDVNYISDWGTGDVHSMGLVWEQPLERLRTWSIEMSSSPQIIYDDTFNAIPRIGKGENIQDGLSAMLAAEDNKQINYLGFEDDYYNILASFAWDGIRIPAYTVDGQKTNANSMVIAGKLTTAPYNNHGYAPQEVQPLIYIDYKTSTDFPDEQISFDTFVGNGVDSMLLISHDQSFLNNPDIWDAAMSTVNNNALLCVFCQLGNFPNCPCPPATSGYVNGFPGVYFVYTSYTPQDDLPAGTGGGQTALGQDHAKGIYNNLHRTISIRLGDMSGIAASQSPLSFSVLYYRLMTHDSNLNLLSSATRGEQWMMIQSPNPAGGGCTIASDKDNSWLIETIFILLAVTILLRVPKHGKFH